MAGSVFAGARRRQRRAARPKVATRRYVKRQIKAGREKLEIVVNNAAANAAYDNAAVFSLVAPITDGKKQEYVKVDTRIKFTAIAAAGATFVRAVIFQWFPDDANEVPAFADIFENGTPAASSILDPIQNITEDNSVKLKIVRDMVIRLGESTATDGSDKVFRRLLITLKSLQRKYIKVTSSG